MYNNTDNGVYTLITKLIEKYQLEGFIVPSTDNEELNQLLMDVFQMKVCA